MRRATALALGLIGFAACGGGNSVAPPPPPPPPAAVASISLPRDTATLVPAATLQLTATAKDAAGNALAGRTITWSSGAAGVATVSTSGLVTAVIPGTAMITATSESKSATATITVKDGALIGVAGGTVTAQNGNVVIVIPAGALAQQTAITVDPAAVVPASALVVPGSAFDLGPTGTQFAQPVAVRIKYDPTRVRTGVPQQVLGLYTAGTTSWSLVAGTTVDSVGHTVQGTTTHFSRFSVDAPGVILTIEDPNNSDLAYTLFHGPLTAGTLTVCVSAGQTYSITLGLQRLDPTIGQITPAVSTSDASVATGSGNVGGQLVVNVIGLGSAELTVDLDFGTLILLVYAIDAVPPCRPVGGAYTWDVGGSDRVTGYNGTAFFDVANPASSPTVRPGSYSGNPGIAFHQTQGGSTLLKYLYVAGGGPPITLASTTGIFWGESFVDGTSLVFSEEPTGTPGKAELFKIARDGTGRTPLTNLGQYMGPPAAAQSGKIYVAWATDRTHPTQIVELSAQGIILRTLTAADLYRWRPAVSQNSRYLAYEQYTGDFSSERIFVMDLNNPTNPPVAASPAVGSGLSASWCGNDYLYFAYTTAAFEGPPYQVMRWSQATGTSAAVPLLAGHNTPQLAIEPTWNVRDPLRCP